MWRKTQLTNQGLPCYLETVRHGVSLCWRSVAVPSPGGIPGSAQRDSPDFVGSAEWWFARHLNP